MKPLDPRTPTQIGSVTNVDKMDTHDRAKLDPQVKFQLLCAEAKATFGRDPRSGGFGFVARPRVILQLLKDLGVQSSLTTIVRLQRAVVLGTVESDVVAWWSDVPLFVRCTVKDDNLYVLPVEAIVTSRPVDRVKAGQLRMAAHHGKLETLEGN